MGAFEGVQQRLRAQERKRVQDAISEGARLGIPVEELTRIGAPTERVIVETARELEVDVLVIPSGRPGWIERHLLADPAQFVVRYAPCCVFLVRTEDKGTPFRILNP
jgi:nucleotide-binding universal stress UspA family protein